MEMHATFWALVPPVVAILLALITKEVYSSLFIGIIVGGLFYSGFSFEGTVTHIFQDGMISVLSDSWNVGILIFLVILGIMVALMNTAGGSAAFGEWASTHIKTRVGAQLATVCLGVLIFIDDYFNCLTVGSVMRPVTDKHNISRAKLAYLIDATAAPVAFRNPGYTVIAFCAALVIFFPCVRSLLNRRQRLFDLILFWLDTVGMAVFTVVGIQGAMAVLDWYNPFLLGFVGVVTGTGGGVIRDVLAGDMPSMFMKRIYITASLLGAVTYICLLPVTEEWLAMLLSVGLICLVRALASRSRWNLPRAKA